MITDDSRKLLRESKSSKVWVQIVLDHILVQGLLFGHTFLRTDEYSDEYRILAILAFLLMTIIYKIVGVYRHENVRNDYIACLLQAWGALVLLLAIFGFVTKTSASFSREVILTWSITSFLGQCCIYYFSRRFLTTTIDQRTPTLIIGGGDLGKHIASHINRNQWVSDHVVGVVDDNESIIPTWLEIGIPFLGRLSDIDDIVAREGVRKVYIATRMSESYSVKFGHKSC